MQSLTLESVRPGRIALIAGLAALTAQTFGAFPGWRPIDETWNALCLLYIVFLFPWWSRERSQGFERYLLLLVAIYPLWIALCTHKVFGQSILYGLLAQRRIVIVAGVLMWIRALRSGYFTLKEVERALLLFIWLLWTIYVGMRVFLDPSGYTDYVGFAVEAVGYPAAFLLQPHWIIFGVLYYAFRAFRTRRITGYLLALILLAGITQAYGTRSQTIGVLLTFFLCLFLWAGVKRATVLLPQILLGTALVGYTCYVIAPAATMNRLGTFSAAYNAIVTGEITDDPSANTHLAELLYAFPEIANHPIFGNGRLSRQWEGGEQDVRGLLFYPDDNGPVGIIYEGGILALLLFAFQYAFAIRAARTLSTGTPNALLDATKGFLLYAALESLFYFEAPLTLFFVALLLSVAGDAAFAELAVPRPADNGAGPICVGLPVEISDAGI